MERVWTLAVSRWLLALGLLALPARGHSAPPPPQAALPTPTLEGELEAALASPALEGATVGVRVVDLGTGTVLFERNPDLPLNPASNAKLVTTAAALTLLGPEHRYATRLYHENGASEGSVLTGDVYLRGSGDPSLVTEDLYALASELRALGIRKITGGVVVDSTGFDRDELPPGFDQKHELASYRAPSGATSVNFNTFVVRVQPGARAGVPAIAGVDPPVASIKLENRATTTAGHRHNLVAELQHEKDFSTVILRGSVGEGAGATSYRYPVTDPSRYAGEVLVSVLQQRGIKLGRPRVRVGPTPAAARLVATHYSDALAVLIRGVNKLSNNFMAEQILKTLADPNAPATFASGIERARAALQGFGISLDGARLQNGSGLYDTNRLSPAQVTAILAAMYGDFRYHADFLASLAVMGVDGTTRSRLRQGEAERWIKAKTGTLDGVTALSGYVGSPNRPAIAFSLLFNDVSRGNAASARAVQNRIAEVLTRYAAGKPLVDVPEP